jgi:hypothetical protein
VPLSDELERLADLRQKGDLTPEEFTEAKQKNLTADVQLLKASIAFLVAGFAAVISFIGLKGEELTTVIRNQEEWVALTGLFLFLAIAVAVVSVFSSQLFSERRLRHVDELFIIAILLASGAVIFYLTPISASTTGCQSVVARSLAAAFLVIGVGLLVLARSTKRWKWLPWLRHQVSLDQLFVFGVIVSLALASLAVLMGLRLEARSQVSAGAQIRASLGSPVLVSGTTDSLVTVTVNVSSSKLPQQDYAFITGVALQSSVPLQKACKSVKSIKGGEGCLDDPCVYPGIDMKCVNVLSWIDPPGANGNLSPQVSFSLSPMKYSRLHIQDQVCVRRLETDACNFGIATTASIDLNIPSSESSKSGNSRFECVHSPPTMPEPWCHDLIPTG